LQDNILTCPNQKITSPVPLVLSLLFFAQQKKGESQTQVMSPGRVATRMQMKAI